MTVVNTRFSDLTIELQSLWLASLEKLSVAVLEGNSVRLCHVHITLSHWPGFWTDFLGCSAQLYKLGPALGDHIEGITFTL